MKHVLPAALILGVASFAVAQPVSIPALPPARPTYCQPVGFRDYEVGIGRIALIRPAPGCRLPSLIRKVSEISGEPGPPIEVPVFTSPNMYVHQWLFISRLEYSLDRHAWLPLRLRP